MNDKNPLTGHDDVEALELPSGVLVFFDLKSGLLFGDGELPAGLTADQVFEGKYGKARPTEYQDELQVIAAHDGSDSIRDLHVESARAVLSGDAQVFITTQKIRDLKRELGLPATSSEVGAVRLHPDTINVSDLSSGPSATKELQQSGADPNAAARAVADAASQSARTRATATVAGTSGAAAASGGTPANEPPDAPPTTGADASGSLASAEAVPAPDPSAKPPALGGEKTDAQNG